MPGKVPNQIPRQRPNDQQLSTQPAGALINTDIASTQGKNLQTIGNTTQQIGDALSKAYTLAEQTKAENLLFTRVSEIQDRASKDPDFSDETRKRYSEEIDNAVSEASGIISLPSAKGIFEIGAEKARQISKIKIGNSFIKKAIDSGKAELANYINTKKEQYVTAGSFQEKQSALLERDLKIEHMASTGFLSKEDAAKMKIKLNQEWDLAHVNYDIETNPIFALEELKKGAGGFYSTIPESARAQALAKSEKRVDYIQKRTREETEDNLMRLDAMKVLTGDQLEEAFLTGSVSKTFYSKMKSKFSSAIGPSAETDKNAYVSAVGMLLDPKIQPAEARERLIEDQAAGKISPDDFKKLYQMHLMNTSQGPQSLEDAFGADQLQSDFEKMVSEDQIKSKNLSKKKNFLNSAIGFIQNTAGGNVQKAADMMQEFYDQALNKAVKPEDLPTIARKIVSRELLTARPELLNGPKTGTILMDAHGNKIRVFPDGTYQEEGK